MGRIGRALARRARGFGLAVHYHNRTRLDPTLEDGAIYHPKAAFPHPVASLRGAARLATGCGNAVKPIPSRQDVL